MATTNQGEHAPLRPLPPDFTLAHGSHSKPDDGLCLTAASAAAYAYAAAYASAAARRPIVLAAIAAFERAIAIGAAS